MWGRAEDTDPRAHPDRVLPPLAVVGDLASLGHGLDQEARQTVLTRVARWIGASDLWSFVRVEDDLFLRDCVGAVPDAGEIARVLDHSSDRADPLDGHLLVHPRVEGVGLVLAAALGEQAPPPTARDREIFDCLASALAAEDATDARSAASRARLRACLGRLTANLIEDALALCDGDRDLAADVLEVSRSELDRLEPGSGNG